MQTFISKLSSLHAQWLLPLLFLAAIAYFTPAIDLATASYFYDQTTNQFHSDAFYDFIYNWTVYPAQVIAVCATLFLVFSYYFTALRPYRRHTWLLILPMAIGAGLLTHAVFKDHWGRPRPRQVEMFGGDQPFRPFYEPNLSLRISSYKSFPCGHCTMGFYFFAVALLGRRLGKQHIFIGGLVLAFALGSLLGLARIVQGGHFFSDVLVSGILMWLTALAFEQWLFLDP